MNTLDFLKGTTAYFRDVLLMHGFMLFVLLPLLTSLSKLVLKEGGIDYISYDNLGNCYATSLCPFDFSTNWAVNFTGALFEFTFYCLVFILLRKSNQLL